MSGFDLDLRTVEEHIESEGDTEHSERRIVLGILDGRIPDQEWIDVVGEGHVLVLSIEGDVNERASGFAREISDSGGNLIHFRGFLIVTPPDISVDTDRLKAE